MDVSVVDESIDYDQAYDVIDFDSIHSILQFDALGDETDIFDMTSLSTLMLLTQTESKRTGLNDSQSEEHTDNEQFRLSLAYEKLHIMPKMILQELSPTIKILDISHNEFEQLGFLSEFKQLTTLICDHNKITSLTSIPYMPKLDLLWMNHCKISELYPWAYRLQQSCPNLRHLSLMGNPAAPSYLNGGSFYEYLKYRLFIISLFPKLIYLDDRSVTIDQKMEAQRMYKRPLLERIACKTPATFPTYLRSVTDKLSEMLAPIPSFAVPQKNAVI